MTPSMRVLLLCGIFATILPTQVSAESTPTLAKRSGFAYPAGAGTVESTEADPKICKKGGTGTILPLSQAEHDWSTPVRRFLYLFGLLWCFIGVAIVADTFMAAIETITSAEKVVQYQGKEFHVKVWNDTVANLTLMALGSSAPEILLSVIEIVSGKMYSGKLGPSTIVGSAAFNLMVILAVCVVAIPAGEKRTIRDVNVFFVTASFSVFAYLWLVIILSVTTPNIVTIGEAVVTFLYFFVLVFIAYGADKKWKWLKKSQVNPKLSIIDGPNGMSKEDRNRIVKKVREEFGENMSDEEFSKYAHWIQQRDAPKSRAYYRNQATRKFVGGKHLHNSTPPPPTITATDEACISFEQADVAVFENKNQIKIPVIRTGSLDKEATVKYMTRDKKDASAKAEAGKDYTAANGDIYFKAGKASAEITVEIKDDDEVEKDEQFEVVLLDQSEGYHLGQVVCTVTILNDDVPGVLGFDKSSYSVRECDGEVTLKVIRQGGAHGDISVKFKTVDKSAVAPADYIHIEGELQFASGEQSKELKVKIIEDDKWERDERFQVHLYDATGGATFSAQTDGLTEKEVVAVTIISDDKIKSLGDLFNSMVNKDRMALGGADWKEQFTNALDPTGGEPDVTPDFMTYFGHFIALPWKLFFAIIPPTHFCGGWVCFFVALGFIGLVTAVISDLASLLGCVFGLDDSITAITFVALGTSLPDTFASKTAAVCDPYADSSIGNVTGSNSVNVFLGLGLPWLIAAVYWAGMDCKPDATDPSTQCREWAGKYAGDWQAEKFDYGFVVMAGDLTTSVVVFSVCAVTTLSIVLYRRYYLGGELGGPEFSKKVTGAIFIGLWLIYITFSILITTGKIDAI